MNMRIDVDLLRQSIDALLVTYPELAEDEQLRMDVLEGETNIDAVLSRLVDAAGDAAAMQDAIGIRIAALQARKARYERQEEVCRSLISTVMDRASISKFTLPEATLSVSWRKPAPFVTDEAALPEECLKVVKKPDMARIKAWVEAGNMPEGIAMSNGKAVLTIRNK